MPAGAPPQHSPVWPLWTRPSPIPRRRFMILPKTRKSVGSHRHHVPVFHAVSVPHTGGRPPYASAALRQFTKNRKVRNPTPRRPHTAAHASQIPACASDPHTGNIPIPPQSDHAPAETSVAGLRKSSRQPVSANQCATTACSPPTASTYGIASRCDDDDAAVGPRVQAGPTCGPREWIPEESGQAGPGKSPQTRRRIAQDGWQITQARPGVTLAPGFAVSTSLLYHVFLEASR